MKCYSFVERPSLNDDQFKIWFLFLFLHEFNYFFHSKHYYVTTINYEYYSVNANNQFRRIHRPFSLTWKIRRSKNHCRTIWRVKMLRTLTLLDWTDCSKNKTFQIKLFIDWKNTASECKKESNKIAKKLTKGQINGNQFIKWTVTRNRGFKQGIFNEMNK